MHRLFCILFGLLVVQDTHFSICSGETVRYEEYEDPGGPWGRQPIVIDETGGYGNILIALHDEISESSQLIEQIKDSFAKASSILSEATRGRVYFRDVSIVLPSHWYRNNSYEAPRANETFHTARVILRDDGEDAAPPSAPFVRQPGGCGEEGEYMYLPRRVLNSTGPHSNFGAPSEVIVKLWGHLRWGLFDEFPSSPDDPLIYQTSQGYEYPSVCPSQEMQAAHQAEQSSPACTSERPCRLQTLCGHTAAGHGSMMGCHLPDSVTQFCHSNRNDDVNFLHNHEAGTMQNRLCLRRSSWDIMYESDDFGRRSTGFVDDTTPRFRLIRHTDVLSVVVLDARENMKENNKFLRMTLAFDHYLYDLFPHYSLLGVVAVNDTVTNTMPCVKLWERPGFRHQAKQGLPSEPTNTSSLGAAIPVAIQAMKEVRGNISGSIIYVMSDGTDEISPTINDVMDEVEEAGVVVVSLPFSENWAENIVLENTVASEYIQHSLLSGVDGRFRDTNVNDPKRFMRIAKFEVTLSTNDSVSWNLHVDEAFHELEQVLVFRIGWKDSIPDVYVWDDDEAMLMYPDSFDEYDNLIEGIAYSGDVIPPIQLQIHVNGSATESNEITCEVYSGVTVTLEEELIGTGPTRAHALLHSPYVNVTERKMIPLYGTVTQDERPVISADVTAVITNPDGGRTVLQLLDDGRGIDNQGQDGTYSSYFSNFTRDGNYSFELSVEVKRPGTWKRSDEHYSSGVISRSLVYPIMYAYDDLPIFQRAPRSIEFTATDVPEDFQYNDYLPPSIITDFRLTDVVADHRFIQFTWTAPGDDFTTGQAAGYDLRYGLNKSSLLGNMDEADQITTEMVKNGNFSEAKPFNETEFIEVAFSVPGDLFFYFAIRAYDDGGNYGGISNILEVDFTSNVKYITSTERTEAPPLVTKDLTDRTENTSTIVMGLLIGISVFSCIGICVMAVRYVVKRNKTRRVDDSPEDDNTLSTSHHKMSSSP